ncbi:methylated-DNA--[protein]-cysteine S-methyltransferase [Salegentibacter sp. F14]
MKIHLKTPLGIAKIKGSEEGVSEIKILDKTPPPTSEVPEMLLPAVEQIEAYFRGELKEFNFKVKLEGTDFQKRVWSALMEIPYGKTQSYMELSKRLGDAKAIRAVASANGRNPLWIVIPCHRVIGSDGSLTGYAGGISRKRWLLEHEGILTQQRLF